jgi:tellurite resistance protein TehA-like permease
MLLRFCTNVQHLPEFAPTPKRSHSWEPQQLPPHHSRSTALTCSTAWGHGLTILAYVLWWIGMSWIVTVCTTLYISSAKLRLVSNRTLPSIIFLPLVGVMTAATVGGIIANSANEISPRFAVPMIIVSFLCIGYGTLVALMVCAFYLFKFAGKWLAYTGEDFWIDSFGES